MGGWMNGWTEGWPSYSFDISFFPVLHLCFNPVKCYHLKLDIF